MRTVVTALCERYRPSWPRTYLVFYMQYTYLRSHWLRQSYLKYLIGLRYFPREILIVVNCRRSPPPHSWSHDHNNVYVQSGGNDTLTSLDPGHNLTHLFPNQTPHCEEFLTYLSTRFYWHAKRFNEKSDIIATLQCNKTIAQIMLNLEHFINKILNQGWWHGGCILAKCTSKSPKTGLVYLWVWLRRVDNCFQKSCIFCIDSILKSVKGHWQ